MFARLAALIMLILMAVGVGFVVFAILEPIMDMSTFGGRH